jgi:hypothetical protein
LRELLEAAKKQGEGRRTTKPSTRPSSSSSSSSSSHTRSIYVSCTYHPKANHKHPWQRQKQTSHLRKACFFLTQHDRQTDSFSFSLFFFFTLPLLHIPVFQKNPNYSCPQDLHTVPEGQEESCFVAFHQSPSSPLRERGGQKKGEGSLDIHPKSISKHPKKKKKKTQNQPSVHDGLHDNEMMRGGLCVKQREERERERTCGNHGLLA